MQINAPTHILTDSQSVMAIARNHVFYTCTKHIEVHYHYVRERLHAGYIDLVYVPTQGIVADIFTKPLPRKTFEAFR
jgi:KUP system potassium uptake protein